MIQFIPSWFILHQNAISILTQAILATVITGKETYDVYVRLNE